jgi:hypothetical protein
VTDRTTHRDPAMLRGNGNANADGADSASGEGHEAVSPLEDLVPVLVARVPAILEEVRELLTHQHPDYADFLTGALAEITAAAEGFFGRLVETARSGRPARLTTGSAEMEQALFEEIGRAHHRQRCLDRAVRRARRGPVRRGGSSFRSVPARVRP